MSSPASAPPKRNWRKILAIAGSVVAGTIVVAAAVAFGASHAPRNARKEDKKNAISKALAASTTKKSQAPKVKSGQKYDLVLTSGILSFTEHTAFLEAVEEAGLKVGGIMGTSAGALVGAMYAAGYTPKEVAAEFAHHAPSSLLNFGGIKGLFTYDRLVARLKEKLPARFEDLKKDFAVSVVDSKGQLHVLDSGALPEAVAAAAAIPFFVQGVTIPGRPKDLQPFKDGGIRDSIGLKAWRDRRRKQHKNKKKYSPPAALVHVVKRSSPVDAVSGSNSSGEANFAVLNQPKSSVNVISIADFQVTYDAEMVAKKMRSKVESSEGHGGHGGH